MIPHAIGKRALWVTLGIALPLLAGCQMALLSRHTEPHGPVAPPSRSKFETQMDEARAQAAADTAEAYWPYAIALLDASVDSLSDAETALNQSLARDHCYAPALSLLSKLYFDQHRSAEAVDRLEAARSDCFASGTPAALLAGLALHYQAIGRHDLARAVMAELPRAARRDMGAAGVYLTLLGDDPDSAQSLAKDALQKDGRSAVNQNNYGITRLRAGRPDEARQAFLEAIDLDPRLPGPYYNLAILERYYVFDDSAATHWMHAYWDRATDDPDSLRRTFDKTPRSLAGKE